MAQFVAQAPCDEAGRPGTSMNASSAYGIRTRVPALRGLCPRPLDERAVWKEGRDDILAVTLRNANLHPAEFYSVSTVGAMCDCVRRVFSAL